MNSRERYLRTIRFAKPDRPAIMNNPFIGAAKKSPDGIKYLLSHYPSDAVCIGFEEVVEDRRGVYRSAVDAWGCIWDSLSDRHLGQVVHSPLSDWSLLDTYRFPDPLYGIEKLEAQIDEIQRNGHQSFIMASVGHVWHRINYLRGYENSLLDVMDESKELVFIRDKIVEILCSRIELLGKHKEDIDCVVFIDDWGTQKQLQIHPEYWRRFFKPSYKRLIDMAHSLDFLTTFHSCGNIQEIIPDFIEIGLDEINPQASCMDLDVLGESCSGKICFRMDPDRQYILPKGSREEVREHILRLFNTFGRINGGYVGYCAIDEDVPMSNAEAMLSAMFELRY